MTLSSCDRLSLCLLQHNQYSLHIPQAVQLAVKLDTVAVSCNSAGPGLTADVASQRFDALHAENELLRLVVCHHR